MAHPKWTPQEDKVVMEEMKNSPTNLTHSYEQAALRIDRTAKAIMLRGIVLRKNKPVFALASERGMAVNTKNINRKLDMDPDFYEDLVRKIFHKLPLAKKKVLVTEFLHI